MPDEWEYNFVVRPGPGAGESVVQTSPDEQLVLPPGHTAQSEAAQTTFDALRAGANTGTFGSYDRAAGAVNALRGAAPDYETGVNEQVRLSEAARARSPWASGAADVATMGAGGLGLARAGVTAVPHIASRLGRLGASAGEGAVLGGLESAGHTYTGRPEDYLAAGAKGAAMGSLFGLGAPAVGAAAEGAYRGLMPGRLTPPPGMPAWMGTIPPRLAEAGRADAAGLTELAAGTRGPRVMLPDVGPATLGTAQGSVLNPVGPGQTALIRALEARNTEAAPYIDTSVRRIFGQSVVPEFEQEAIRARMTALGPQYDRLLNGPNVRAVDTAPIANWLEAEAINSRGKRQAAAVSVRNMLDISGNRGTLDPHPRTLQAVRSDIKNTLRDREGTLTAAERSLLEEADRRMTAELHVRVPGIKRIDDAYAELGAQERALDTRSAGSRIFDTARESVIRPEQLQRTMAEAAVPKGSAGASAEPMRLRQAARAELDRIVGTNRDDLAALERVLAQPQDYNSRKLATMFGQDRADRIAQVIRDERAARNTHTAVVGGSQTAQRQAAMASQDAQSGRLPLDLTLTGAVTRGVGWAKDQLFQAQAAAQRDNIARFLASRNPIEVQAAARQLLAAQPSRDARAMMARTLAQGGFRGTSAGFVPKEERTE